MKWWMSSIALATVIAVVAAAPAQGIFGLRKSAHDPSPQVSELIAQLQESTSDSTRADAAEQLRQFSAMEYPEIVPALVSALQNDKSASVRVEAARSLGRIRPLTSRAREALSRASLRDAAIRVRWQARASLAFFTVASVNPYNHPSSNGPSSKVKVTTKDAAGDKFPPDSPQPPLFPGGQPSNGKGTSGYALPLPKGPAQTIFVPAKPNPGSAAVPGGTGPDNSANKQGPLLGPPNPRPEVPAPTPTNPTTDEPPLLPFVPPPPANPANPTPPSEGPILFPPP